MAKADDPWRVMAVGASAVNEETMSANWAVFVATIDRVALDHERPGSEADQAMRRQHAAKVNRIYHASNDAEWAAALHEAAMWNERQREPRQIRDAANRRYKDQREAARAARKAA